MNKSVRQNEIFKLVKQKQTCTIAELADRLNVSGETIRRNVKRLVDEGLVLKVHGGITLPFLEHEPHLLKRMATQINEKKAIAELVAGQIEDGDSVIIDSGSTTAYVAKALKNHSNLTVVTNSSYIASQLAGFNNNRIFMAGGELGSHDAAAYGPSAIDFISKFEAKKAILSIAALHETKGCMDHHLCEAEVSKTIIKQAQMIIVATDSSKFGRTGLMKVCELHEIDLLVTDEKPGQDLQISLDSAKVKILIAETTSN